MVFQRGYLDIHCKYDNLMYLFYNSQTEIYVNLMFSYVFVILKNTR